MSINALLLIVLIELALFPLYSHALLITNATSIPSPNPLIDFEQFGTGFTFTGGPVQIGNSIGENVIWSTTQPHNASVIGSVFYGLGSNGGWNTPKTFVGLNGTFGLGGSMLFEFINGTVNAVGGFINYAPGSDLDVLVEALDVNGSILESYNINLLAPISTSGTNQGAFRGILRNDADIAAFRLSNSFVVLDDLTFSEITISEPVPEPSTILLVATGLIGLVGFRKKFKK